MNRRKRRAGAIFLILLMWGIRPAYGAGGSVESTEVKFSIEDGSAKVETEVLGTIDVALISAILPSDVEFLIDPEGDFDAVSKPDGQIRSPQSFTITNNSVVPVCLEISRIDELKKEDVSFTKPYAGGPEQNFQLVDKVEDAGQSGNAILVLAQAGTTYFSTTEFERYAICPGKSAIPVLERIESGEQASLQVYGKVSADFYGSYRFTVRPTLKISAVRSN